MKRIIKRLEGFIESIEGLNLNLIWWILGFLAIVFARNFLSTPSVSALMFFDHFLLFYVGLFFAITLLLHFLTGERIERVSKAVVTFWFIILLTPILDSLFFGGGRKLSYFLNAHEIPYTLLNFFNPFVQFEGVSPGLRIEVVIVVILAVFYTYIKSRSAVKSICGFVGSYLIIIFIGFLPAIFATVFSGVAPELAYDKVFRFGGIVQTGSQGLALLFTFVSSFLLCIWLFRYDRKKWKAAVSNLRPLRSIHYVGMTLLGILLGFWLFRDAYPVVFGTPIDFLACLGLLFSVFFAYQSAVAVNDIFDIESDKISNNSRPLVKKKLSSGDVKILAVIYMFIALLFAINVKYSCFSLVLVSIILSLVYSVPPLKLKRFFPVSTFIIALAALVTLLTGFSIFGGWKSVYIFPKSLTLLVLVIFTLAGTVKDLKDFEGDKRTGIKTLPVLLGRHRGKIVIALFVLLSYILIAPIIRMPILFIPAIVFGILSVFIILKKELSEKPIFVLYFAFFIILAFFIRKNIDTLRTSRVKHQIDAVGHFLSGETYFRRGKYGHAINEYKKAILYSYKDERIRLQ